jgi:hypothetical protein|nr:hypothetical protein [Kofleriaceae bacterium]
MRTRLQWLVACGVVVAPAVASADSFVTLDRQDRTSSAGFEASYLDLKDAADPTHSSTLFRFDAHAQYVTPGGFGAYIAVPFSYVNNDNSNWALDDLEVGGIYVLPQQSPGLDIVLHAGLALPTGSSDLQGALQNLIASSARWNDFYLALGDATSLRLGASAIYRSGALVARVDLGVDANLSNNNSNASNTDTADTFVRLNVGVGVDLSHQALLMAELVNLYDPGADGDFSTKVIDSGAISLRYTGASVHPYVALVLPLDDDAKSFASTAVTLGVDAPLQ